MKKFICQKCCSLFYDRQELRRHVTRQHVLKLGERFHTHHRDQDLRHLLSTSSQLPSSPSGLSSISSFHWSEFDPELSTRATSPARSDSSLESFSWSTYDRALPSSSVPTTTASPLPNSPPQPVPVPPVSSTSFQLSIPPSSPSTVTPRLHFQGLSLSDPPQGSPASSPLVRTIDFVDVLSLDAGSFSGDHLDIGDS